MGARASTATYQFRAANAHHTTYQRAGDGCSSRGAQAFDLSREQQSGPHRLWNEQFRPGLLASPAGLVETASARGRSAWAAGTRTRTTNAPRQQLSAQVESGDEASWRSTCASAAS